MAEVDKARRAIRAQELLRDAVLLEAVEAIMLTTFKQWRAATDPEIQARLWMVANGVDLFLAQLTAWVQAAKVEGDRGA